jgi:hypothetical protein
LLVAYESRYGTQIEMVTAADLFAARLDGML